MRFIVYLSHTFPHRLMLKYLKAKGIDYHAYQFIDGTDTMQRLSKKKERSTSIDNMMIFLKDMGDSFEWSPEAHTHLLTSDFHKSLAVRTDEVLMALVEENPRYANHIFIHKQAPNERFYLETNDDGEEFIVLESSHDWIDLRS